MFEEQLHRPVQEDSIEHRTGVNQHLNETAAEVEMLKNYR